MHRKAILHLKRTDKILGRLISQVGPCGLQPESGQHPLTPYRALIEAVAHQQLTGKAAATILGRMKALFPMRDFPEPADVEGIPDEHLRKAGFSRAKVAALKDIAAKTLAGTVPTLAEIQGMPDEAIINLLTTIRGVGQWTVEMLLIFQLGRADVLPVDDYGVRKGFSLIYDWTELPTRRELLEYGERWRPHRSVASWYLWRALDGQRRPAAKSKSTARQT